MNDDQVPHTHGVEVELLATVDLGREFEAMDGFELRMRRFTMQPGPCSVRSTITQEDRAQCSCLREPSRIIGMELPLTTVPARAGTKTGILPIGSRTEEQLLQWRSRSISSGRSRPGRDLQTPDCRRRRATTSLERWGSFLQANRAAGAYGCVWFRTASVFLQAVDASSRALAGLIGVPPGA